MPHLPSFPLIGRRRSSSTSSTSSTSSSKSSSSTTSTKSTATATGPTAPPSTAASTSTSTHTKPSLFHHRDQKPLPEARPSASILLLSPTNQVLLLHRVKTSKSFASAHVFPGGNLSEFHDGHVPPPGDPARHMDSLPYRLAAIRETFEESGILLARKGGRGGPLLHVSPAERDRARRAIYQNEISFVEWVRRMGGVLDTDNLLPFTRWVTPPGPARRFTTQMYVYMLPLEDEVYSASSDASVVNAAARQEALIPTPDGGAEVTTAQFDDAATWLALQRRGDITLFPPQYFLLHLLAQFLTGEPLGALDPDAGSYYRAQRERLRTFLRGVPTSSHPAARGHPTSSIPWAEKVISPSVLGVRRDGRTILALDQPGPELKGSGRGGDWERVVLVRFGRAGPVSAEVKGREEVLAEERDSRSREETAKL